METRYVAEFKVGRETEKESQVNRKKDVNEIVEKDRKFDSKTVGKVLTTGIAVSMTASRLYQMQQSTSNAIKGDSIAQRRLDNRMAYINEGLGLIGGVGIALLINPATAAAVAGAQAVRYGIQAYTTAKQNQIIQAKWQVESIVNQERQNKLVKDITGIRI